MNSKKMNFKFRKHYASARLLCAFMLLPCLAWLLAGCTSANSAMPAAITVTLPQSAATVDVGTTLQLTATVANDPTIGGVSWTLTGGGALSNQTTTAVTYTGPAASGTAAVTATAVADKTKSASTAVTVAPLPTITSPAQLPPVTVGQPYSFQLTESGGTAPFTWAITQGQLPAGLTLDSKTGLISGTVVNNAASAPAKGATSIRPNISTAAASPFPGPHDVCLTLSPPGPIVIGMTDSATPPQQSVTGVVLNVTPLKLVIHPPIGLLWPPPEGVVGGPYLAPFGGMGGVCPLTFDVNSGALPPGIQLDTTSEFFSGTPTTVGTYNFTLRATDGETPIPLVATVPLTIRIVAPVEIATSSLPSGALNTLYDQTLAATGGYPGDGINWSLASGSGPLPPGLTLSSAGEIKGTPTSTGTFTFTVCAFDPVDPQPGSTCATSVNGAIKNLSFTINTTAQPDFSLSVSPSTLIVDAGGPSATSTVTLAPANGFSSNVALSVSGQPTGVTATLNPTSTSGSGTSTLTVASSSSAPSTVPPATLTISGTSGTTTHSAKVTLTVSSAIASTGVLGLVSQTPGGAAGNGPSSRPAASLDGRFVAFSSSATNLTSDPTGGVPNIFVRDTCLGVSNCTPSNLLVSKMDPSFPATPNGGSDVPSITPDGRFVSFESDATHLIAGGTQHSNVYRRRICLPPQPNCTESTTLISVNTAGVEGNGRSHNSSISANGRFVAFQSDSSNLFSGTNPGELIFVRDTCFEAPASPACTPSTKPVSADTAGNIPSIGAFGPAISANGRYVAFVAAATNLPPNDSATHAYLRDTCGGVSSPCTPVTTLVASSITDVQDVAINADGRYVALTASVTTNVGPFRLEVFVADTCTGVPSGCPAATTPVSVQLTNSVPDGDSADESISADGRFVAYFSAATQQVAGDTNGLNDVFVRDICIGTVAPCTPQTIRISSNQDGTQGNGNSGSDPVRGFDGVSIAPNGQRAAFVSTATNLLPTSFVGDNIFLAATGFSQPPAVASLAAVSPSSVTHGAGDLVLRITGSGFLPGAVVHWNGSPRDTTYINAATLEVFIPSPDTASAGSPQITVVNPAPGSGSGGFSFTIN